MKKPEGQITFEMTSHGSSTGWTFPKEAEKDPKKVARLIDFSVRQHLGLGSEEPTPYGDVVDTTGEVVTVDSELVPVYALGDRRFVNARELHSFLEVGKDFTTWIKDRIEKYGFREGEDYSPILVNRSGNTPGKPRTEYQLFMDTAKEIAMVENNEKGRMVRRHFIEIEKRYREGVSASRPKKKEPQVIIEERFGRPTISSHIVAGAFGTREAKVLEKIDMLIASGHPRENITRSCYKSKAGVYHAELLMTKEAFEIISRLIVRDDEGDQLREKLLMVMNDAEAERQHDIAVYEVEQAAALAPPPLEPQPEPEPEPKKQEVAKPVDQPSPKPSRSKNFYWPEEAAAALGLRGYRVLYERMRALGMIVTKYDKVVPVPAFSKYVRVKKYCTKSGCESRRIVITVPGMDYLKTHLFQV